MMARQSFTTLFALFGTAIAAQALDLAPRDYCNVVVTYTTTVYEYATKEGHPSETPGHVYEASPSMTAYNADYTTSHPAGHTDKAPDNIYEADPSATDHQVHYTATYPAGHTDFDYTSALSNNPYPVPVEYETCFNRSSTAAYAYSTYSTHSTYTIDTATAYPTHKPSSYQSAPIYGQPNATTPAYPTGTGTTNTTKPDPAPCSPDKDIELDGASEYGYNTKNAPFSVRIRNCSKFQINSTTAFANFKEIPGLTVTPDAISFPGFEDDYVLISVFALDSFGSPVIKSWELHFGSVDMPILILNPDDSPAEGVYVEANATIFPGLTGSCTTDASGECTIQSLPGTTIGLVARKEDNSIAVNGLAPTTTQVTLKLLPFTAPKDGASFGVDNGLAGWTGGQLKQSVKVKRDTTLVVDTNGEYTLQSASNSFPTNEGTKKAYIKYRFITSEVPGGYFGTQFNDYFSVTIRSDTGAFISVTNSMNALGLGAFDASGATNVFTLTLDVPANTKSIMFDVGVSNVADNLYDSSLVIESVGENKCDKCDTCENCPERAACQPNCKNPPPQSCNFYADCAEKELNCGASGYPIRYGQKNCLAFSRNLDYFTTQGQNFVWGTMSCLQQFLSPLIQNCDESCPSISAKAFASHPKCYTDNGFCSLGCGDILVLLAVVNKDLLESGEQIFQTAKICLSNAGDTLKGCAGEILVGTAAAVTFGGSVPWTIAAVVAGRYLGGLAGVGDS